MIPLEPEFLDAPEPEFERFLNARIDEFNHERWDVKTKVPIGARVRDEDGVVRAGAFGRTFGTWLLIDTLWVDESLRGQAIGSRLLRALEDGAYRRGCRSALLDTLDFQARPFYERHGFAVGFAQENYPRTGVKYFMTKTLDRPG